MDKIKIFYLIICCFVFCESVLCQTADEPEFVERYSATVIYKKNNISLEYYFNPNNPDLVYIDLGKDIYCAKFVFFINDKYQDLFVAYLDKLSENHFKDKEIIRIPYNYYLFQDNSPIFIDSDIEREFRYLRGEDYYQNYETPYQKYSYLVKDYSHLNKQLLRKGNAFSYFYHDFIFENCDVFRYGEWLEFENPVIKTTESLTDYFDFKLENICHDFVHENKLINGKLKWTLTDSAMMFQISFSLNENKSFNFMVNIESKPYIEDILIKDSEAENIIAHYFSTNGNITKSITSDNAEVVSFLYDDEGFLTAKITQKADNPTEAIKETFVIDKEYKTKVMDEDVEY